MTGLASGAALPERGFGKTLLVGAAAAVSLPFFVPLMAALVGDGLALSLHWVLVVVGYLMLLASGARRRLGVALAGGIAIVVALALASSAIEVIVGATGVLAIVRSGCLYRSRPARAVLLEGVLAAAALSVVHFLLVPGLFGNALALWGWFVVQSFFFLVGGVELRRSAPGGDPFDVARRRLLALL